MSKEALKGIAARFLKIISKLLPVKKNRVVLKSVDDKFNCNPKHICEYILANYGKDKFDLIYISDNPETKLELEKRGIKCCKSNTPKYFYYMFTAKFVIVNTNYPQFLPKKKSQIAINTWHGGGSYKRLIDNHTTPEEYARIDEFISSCKSFSKNNLIDDFFVKEENIFEIGMPRNDIFFTDYSEIKRKVKDTLNIEQSKKVILYAPTFIVHKKELIPTEFKKIISACEKRFGGEFVLVNRDHNFSLKDTSCGANESFVYESQIIKDTQEVICAADVVITDYSSIMWDASLSKAPCFIYAHNFEEYNKFWDFYTPMSEWPYPIGKTIDELANNILNFNEAEYKSAVAEHHRALGSFENGTACKQLVDYMMSEIN